MLAGLICFADLFYTYFFIGDLPIVRIYEVLLYGEGNVAVMMDENILDSNHNFFGQICGMCLVYFFCDYLNNQRNGFLKLLLLPVMLLGVLMSTSRSALVAVLIVMFLIGLSSFNLKEKKRNLFKLTIFGAGSLIVVLLLFSLLILCLP